MSNSPTVLVVTVPQWWAMGIGADCDWCESFGDECMHCAQKKLIANVAVAWAFDLGYFNGLIDGQEVFE